MWPYVQSVTCNTDKHEPIGNENEWEPHGSAHSRTSETKSLHNNDTRKHETKHQFVKTKTETSFDHSFYSGNFSVHLESRRDYHH